MSQERQLASSFIAEIAKTASELHRDVRIMEVCGTHTVELRKQGKSIMEATVLAGEMRLRPIIMTSLAFIFGVLPLALAMGAGANARHSIGTGIIGGMIGETTLAMLYVPLLFYLFERFGERGKEKAPAGALPPPEGAPHAAAGGGTES